MAHIRTCHDVEHRGLTVDDLVSGNEFSNRLVLRSYQSDCMACAIDADSFNGPYLFVGDNHTSVSITSESYVALLASTQILVGILRAKFVFKRHL